ncbi:uncharacterized protein ATNIH1004_002006 [Aspergillus tanneri]|uniref:Uncharacterized protein n=1 Tax=Aspergillus tanneri TaxID=1220188 RepID=A0A5M9M3L7_9EURO|nr:uncharacterized protein ATNIH1004_002006 [Aspergillus tanneri]KAA8641338.1 hypothetical protein ATNIH1004_002006 [Aspergillus tanneri]
MALDTEGGSKQLNKMSSDAHISMGNSRHLGATDLCPQGIGSESAYSSIEESMVDYLCKLHQENREVRDIKRKVDRKLGTMAVRPGELAKMAYSGTKVAFMYPEFLR